MTTTAKEFAAFLFVLTLSACAGHSHRLASDNGMDRVTGVFSDEGAQEPMMVLEIDGTRYEGKGFTIKRSQNLSELRRMYGLGKHYDQITSGMDSDHFSYSATPELRASNGETIRCVMAWKSGQAPAGVCTALDGKEIAIRAGR